MFVMDAYRELLVFASPQQKELNFNSANHNSIKHIKPSKYGGGYCFQESGLLESTSRNRFLYWRICGSKLEFQDVSFDFHLTDGSLRIVFQNATIACEPDISETAENVIVLVVTTTGIYRFQFPHPRTLNKGKSVLSTNSSLPSIFMNASPSNVLGSANYYMFPTTPSMAQFTCASTCHLSDNSSLYSFSNQNGNVILFNMAPPLSFSANVSMHEVKQSGVVSRFLGGIVTSVVGNTVEGGQACSDMCILQDATDEPLVCAVTWDFKLKIWSADTFEMMLSEDMFTQASSYIDRNKVISAGSKNMIRKYVGKTNNGEQLILIGVFLNIPNNIQFHVYQISSSGSSYALQPITVFYDAQEELIDFIFDSEMFWTVWATKGPDYFVKFEYLTNKSIDSTWTEVMMSTKIEEELNVSPSIDPRQLYLDHIFYPDRFSKDAIIKALSSYTHQSGSFAQRLQSVSRKELKSEICLAVEEQIRLAAADVDFDVQESEYLELQMQQWSTLYSYCYRNEERNRKIMGIVRDTSTGLVTLVREKCFSTLKPSNVLDQYYLDDIPPPLKRYQEFYPNIHFDESIHRRMGKLLKCLRLMNCPSTEEVWEENFGTPAFNPLALAQRHAHQLMVMPEMDFDNSIKQLGGCHLSIAKFVMELLDSSMDRLNYYEDMHMDDDDARGNEEILRQLFSSAEGLKVLVETVKQSNETRYQLAKGLLVLAVYLRSCTDKLTGSQVVEVEQLISHLCQLVGSLHAILWCASTTVLATDICCVDKTKKSLELLNQFKHDSNFNLLESEENSMTLLELFLLAQGREEVFNKFSNFLKTHFNLKAWMNVLPCIADLVSMCLRPDLSGFIFPLTLFNCCQHLHLQHYTQMVQVFYQQDVGTLNLFLGLSYLATNEAKKALHCFKEVRQYIGAEEYLMQLVADADPLYMETIYSMKIMSLFEEFQYPSLLIDFAKYTIELGDNDDPNLATIWMKIFRSELELCHYENAYDALFRNPEPSRQKDCLRQFLAVLCEKKEYKILVSLRYRSRGTLIEDEAATILESRARSSDVTRNNYYDLLYAFYVQRKNFRCAASVMYECATRWGQEVSGLDGLKRMVEYLTTCHNCLLLVDQRNAWIVKPPASNADLRGSNGSAKHSSEGMELRSRSKGCKNVEVLNVKDVEKELMMTSSLLSIHESYGENSKKIIPVRAVAMKTGEVVRLLCNSGLYDKAFQLSTFFGLSLIPVFESLVLRCLGTSDKSTSPDQMFLGLDNKHQMDWLDYNEDATCPTTKKYATSSDRAWRILQTNLEKFETPSSTRGYRCCALKMFYSNFPLPSWFTAAYKKFNPAELMMLYSEYGHLQDASDLALQYVEAVAGKGKDYFNLKDYLHAGCSAVWLPYKIIDNILQSFDNLSDTTQALATTISSLREALKKHFKLVEHSSRAVVYSAH